MNNFAEFSDGRDAFGNGRDAGWGRGAFGDDVGGNARDGAAPTSVEPFAFVELERKTSDFLDKVRGEARRIADETRFELDALRADVERKANETRAELERSANEIAEERRRLDAEKAELVERRETLERETFDEARAAGFAAGKAEAAATLAADIERGVEEKSKAFCDAALEPLRRLTAEMTDVRRSLLKHWEENATQIAAAIAYQTIMRDPAIKREVPLDLLREALELAMNCAALKIRMNPNDVENLRAPIRAILEETGNLATAEVVPDAKITAGGCVVESSLGVIDERLESRLERIVAELSD